MTPMRLWIGVVLLALGVFGVLDATGTLESSETIDRWWPVAIIGAGVVGMATQRRVSLGPIIIMAIGFVLLADRLEWTLEDLVGPAVLVIIGLAVLMGASRAGRSWGRGGEGERPLAVFGASKVKDHSEHFTRADVTAIFGGSTLDLREAHIDQEATVDATAVFGGVDILVPRGWRVSVRGVPIFGGYEDKTEGNGSLPADAPRLNVRATAIFGGVDVAHEPK